MCNGDVCDCHRTGKRRPLIDPRGATLPLVPSRVDYLASVEAPDDDD